MVFWTLFAKFSVARLVCLLAWLCFVCSKGCFQDELGVQEGRWAVMAKARGGPPQPGHTHGEGTAPCETPEPHCLHANLSFTPEPFRNGSSIVCKETVRVALKSQLVISNNYNLHFYPVQVADI